MWDKATESVCALEVTDGGTSGLELLSTNDELSRVLDYRNRTVYKITVCTGVLSWQRTNWVTAKFLSLIFALLLLYAIKLWGRIPASLFSLQEQTWSAKNHTTKENKNSLHIWATVTFSSHGDDFVFTVKTAASFWHCTCRLTSWSPVIISWNSDPLHLVVNSLCKYIQFSFCSTVRSCEMCFAQTSCGPKFWVTIGKHDPMAITTTSNFSHTLSNWMHKSTQCTDFLISKWQDKTASRTAFFSWFLVTFKRFVPFKHSWLAQCLISKCSFQQISRSNSSIPQSVNNFIQMCSSSIFLFHNVHFL